MLPVVVHDLHQAIQHLVVPHPDVEFPPLVEAARGQMWKGGKAVSAQFQAPDLQVPLSILGSSLFGAAVSAMLGLPFAFASR
jgi:hypothetical protein